MWVCITILGFAVVPEVKNSSSGSSAPVTRSGVNSAGASYASSYRNQPGGSPPTASRVDTESMFSNLAAWSAAATTNRTCPLEQRSARSSRLSIVVAGINTAPSFIAASTVSQSGGMLPIMSSNRSPRLTPRPRRWLATRDDRSASSANVNFVSEPFSFANQSATWSRRGPRPIWSNQSSAQLNCFKEGHRKSA